MAERAFVDARRIVRETPADEKPEAIARFGLGFAGLGGLLYGLTIAGDLLESPAILDDAARLAGWIDTAAITAQPPSDLLGGVAGAIPGLMAIAARQPASDDDATAAAMTCARVLAAQGDMASDLLIDGFGHGVSGTSATLALLADQDQDTLALSADPHRAACGAAHGPVGWCKGPIGWALAQMTARYRRNCVHSVDVAAVEHAVAASLADRHALDQVCCGLFGGVEALLAAARHGRPDLSTKAHILARALLARAERNGGFRLLAGLRPGFDSPGFFQGTSGIGYTLLRLARPQLLPSILLTEWRP
jgi:lantibiotic modifying enzyme